MKIKSIPSADPRVNPHCVRLLTEMQRRAKRGEFQNVALATVTSDGPGLSRNAGTAWSANQDSVFAMAGAISHLQMRFDRDVVDGQ